SAITLERRTASSTGHVSTESSQVLPKWTPSVGIAIGQQQSLMSASDRADVLARTNADLLFAFGLFDWTELSVHLPLLLRQQLRTPGSAKESTTGLGDLRVGLKGTILRTPLRGFGLGVMFDVTAPTGSARS